MPIVPGVRENNIRPELTRQAFEGILYLGELGWEIPIPKCMHANRLSGRGTQESLSPSLRLALALPHGTKNNPAEFGPRPSSGQLE
jgi:hypothetical protein